MKSPLRKPLAGIARRQGWWLILLLLLAVLVPSACLLWFMNQAVRNEQLAVRQRLLEAYRAQLTGAQKLLLSQWKEVMEEMEARAATNAPASVFAWLVESGLTDSAIVYDASGRLAYPEQTVGPDPDVPVPAWAEAASLEPTDPGKAAISYAAIAASATEARDAALALQAQARCLLQDERKAEALAVLHNLVSDSRFRIAPDAQGRLVVPGALWLMIELIGEDDSERVASLKTELRSQIEDYNSKPMPATQRRFLMRRFQREFPGEPGFPKLAAEELAENYLEADSPASDPVLRPAGIPGLWHVASPGGRVVALHRTETLKQRVETLLQSDDTPNILLSLTAPGDDDEQALDSVPAGTMFPGWRVALSLTAPGLFQTATAHRTRTYLWIGALCVAIVSVLMLLALGMVRRQLALTRLRNDLVANVTHELKTPLSSMRLLVETLLNSPRVEEKTAREYLQMIAHENLRLSRLIDNFLAFSRIERNKFAFEFKEVEAQSVLNEAATAVRERFSAPGCRFRVEHPEALPILNADRDALVTALVNLLDNAHKYSGEDKEIVLSGKTENGCVEFAVSDNGIGIPADERRRIFTRFYRVQPHLSGHGGAGIGLSIVEFVASAHRGTVDVQSNPGGGSKFTIRIPAVKPQSPHGIAKHSDH